MVPQFKIALNNSYIILLFVNFTTLPCFANTGEHLVKIWLKSDWYWARSSNFPQKCQKGCRVTLIGNYTCSQSINEKSHLCDFSLILHEMCNFLYELMVIFTNCQSIFALIVFPLFKIEISIKFPSCLEWNSKFTVKSGSPLNLKGYGNIFFYYFILTH